MQQVLSWGCARTLGMTITDDICTHKGVMNFCNSDNHFVVDKVVIFNC